LVKWRFDDNRLILFIKKFHWARRKDHDHADKFLNLPQYSAHPTIAQYFPYQNLSDILAPPANLTACFSSKFSGTTSPDFTRGAARLNQSATE